MKELTPKNLRPPFGNYAHGTAIPAGWRLLRTSGQLGIAPDDTIPEHVFDQAMICFENIRAILSADDMTPADIAHISVFVTDREHMQDYMRARDIFLGDAARLPGSTLVIVAGFTRPEFKVEIEVMAAKPDQRQG